MLLASLEFAILSRFCRRGVVKVGDDNQTKEYSKLDRHFGPGWKQLVEERTVADFGSGLGNEVIQMASAGARRVYGIEISETQLTEAKLRLGRSGVTNRCLLLNSSALPEPVDCVFSFDSFEHFADPSAVLEEMVSMLKPGGRIYISFGPTWLHPLGGHAFTPFPWGHLLLSERALVQWRNLYYPGTASSFETSGLNRMTIKRFVSLISESKLQIESTDLVPIRRLRYLHNRLTREWTTAVVHAVLRKPEMPRLCYQHAGGVLRASFAEATADHAGR